MTIKQVIKTICPTLYSLEQGDEYIALAEMQVSKDFFGSQYPLAVAYMACHLWMTTKEPSSDEYALTNSVGAPIQSVSENGMSVSYASLGEGLHATIYGTMLSQLMNGKPAFGVVASDQAEAEALKLLGYDHGTV
jgi:hypothetical protein